VRPDGLVRDEVIEKSIHGNTSVRQLRSNFGSRPRTDVIGSQFRVDCVDVTHDVRGHVRQCLLEQSLVVNARECSKALTIFVALSQFTIQGNTVFLDVPANLTRTDGIAHDSDHGVL